MQTLATSRMLLVCGIVCAALVATNTVSISASSEELKSATPHEAKTENRCLMNVTNPRTATYQMINITFTPKTTHIRSKNGKDLICSYHHLDDSSKKTLQSYFFNIKGFGPIFNRCDESPFDPVISESLIGLIANLGLEQVTGEEILKRDDDLVFKKHCIKYQRFAPLTSSKGNSLFN